MTDLSLELNALFGPNWYAGKFLAVKVRCLPGFTRKRKVRGKGGYVMLEESETKRHGWVGDGAGVEARRRSSHDHGPSSPS